MMSISKVLFTTALLLAVVGCNEESNFYQLKPISKQKVAKSSIKKSNIVAIAEIQVADYLDKPQIVTRVNSQKLELNELNRWVGDIGKNIQSVLQADLSDKLRRYTILSKPLLEPIDENYTLYVSIDRFDGDIGSKNVVLQGHWSIVDTSEHILLRGKKFRFIKHSTASLDSIIETQSQLLNELALQIASNF
jgi:uncharacterized lipoprotein YmbA